jgi:hypothetical protein
MWQKRITPGNKPDGQPILSVLGKCTWDIAPGKTAISDNQVPFAEADILEDPDQIQYSELLAETDLIAYKPTTDVIVTGKAIVPGGRKAFHIECFVQVGELSKSIVVFGNRSVQSKALRGLSIGDPEPFTEIVLGYKNAYGGVAKSKDGTLHSYFPNPIGKGFTFKGGFEDPSSIVLPNIEDPQSPLTIDNMILSKPDGWVDAPKPASLGWTRRNFYPRYTYAGLLPEQLQGAMENAKSLDKNEESSDEITMPSLDFKMFQGASDGLYGVKLTGNEHVRLQHLDSEYSVFEFQLPGNIPKMGMNTGNGFVELVPELQTVVIDMEEKLLSMVWRGAMDYDGLEQLKTFKKFEYKVMV